MKTLRHSLWLTLLLLAGCSVIQSQEGSPIPEDGQFAVLPLINLSQTPQAGDQAASVPVSYTHLTLPTNREV